MTDPATIASHKQAAARAAAELVRDGMAVGLGTGSTVAYLLSALGERSSELRGCRCVASSPQTARIARTLGLTVCELDDVGELDIAIDGADQVDPACWLVKGGGGAHTREKIVAAAAGRFVVIVSSEKLVAQLGPPVPLELLSFGVRRTLAELEPARLRTCGDRLETEEGSDTGRDGARCVSRQVDQPAETMISPDGNLLAWYDGPADAPYELAARLSATPGVVEHGLFAPEMVSEVLIAGVDGVRRRTGAKAEG